MDGVRADQGAVPMRRRAQLRGTDSPPDRIWVTTDRVAAGTALRPQRFGGEEYPVTGRPEPVDPRPAPGTEPLPPAREQLPLPRRRQQAHLEPQLRERGGSGAGTPFSAFGTPNPTSDARGSAASGPVGKPSGPTNSADASAGERTARIELPTDRAATFRAATFRAATFRAATRRGRRPGTRPHRPRPDLSA